MHFVCQTSVVFLNPRAGVAVISCGGITTHLPDNVTSSFTVDAKETKIDSTLSWNVGQRAELSRLKVCC